jgi:GTP-binding protein HflX
MDLEHGTYRERAYIIHPVRMAGAASPSERDIEAAVEEARGLARGIDLDILGLKIFKIAKISPGQFLGSGQADIAGEEIQRLKPRVVIVNDTLSPVQQRNLERLWKVKVIDRTGLILEIFGARAQTREGRLQVRLAALAYQKSRLVRAWTHLERQRGGAGFLGGPGETQMELDRRRLDEKINRLKRDLEDVRRMRDLGRKSRERVPFPVIALVGYTNAGKSTLFNTITDSKVFAEDLLFATLDPTMRRITLPNGQAAILSDTVGFISNLPTHLVASFRATLEQIAYADVIAHVIDVSRPHYEAQRQDVMQILGDLGISYETDTRIIEIYNKMDAAPPETIEDIERQINFAGGRKVMVSAIEGRGVDGFLESCVRIVASQRQSVTFDIGSDDGAAQSWLHQHGEVIAQDSREDRMIIDVLIDPADIGKFKTRHGYDPRRPDERRKKDT